MGTYLHSCLRVARIPSSKSSSRDRFIAEVGYGVDARSVVDSAGQRVACAPAGQAYARPCTLSFVLPKRPSITSFVPRYVAGLPKG